MTRAKPLLICDNVYWISPDAAGWRGKAWKFFRAGRRLHTAIRPSRFGAARFTDMRHVADEVESLLMTRFKLALTLALISGFGSASMLTLLFSS